MMRRRITLRNSCRDGYKSDRHQSAADVQLGFHHRMASGEIID
jgi:hypothetical protein